MAIYSGFTHQKLLFSIAMLRVVYQRVIIWGYKNLKRPKKKYHGDSHLCAVSSQARLQANESQGLAEPWLVWGPI